MKKSLCAAVVGTAVFVCALVFIPDAYSTTPDQTKDPEQIVMSSCSACHSVDRICKKLGTKDKDVWSKLVTGMVKKGAKVEQQDIPLVADYLAGLKPGAKPVCK